MKNFCDVIVHEELKKEWIDCPFCDEEIDTHYCNEIIHEELKKEWMNCPFCNEEIYFNYKPKKNFCCDDQELMDCDGRMTCKNCATLNYNIMVLSNKQSYVVKRKSVYDRKYHIEKILRKMVDENVFSHKNLIIDWFKIIDDVLNGKRIFSARFVVSKLLSFLRVPHKKFYAKTKETRLRYEEKWSEVLEEKSKAYGVSIRKLMENYRC